MKEWGSSISLVVVFDYKGKDEGYLGYILIEETMHNVNDEWVLTSRH